MKILVVDPIGAALDFCMRCEADGHKVKWFVFQTEKTKNIGRGLIEIVTDWRPFVRWCDFIFLSDNTKYLKELDGFREDGVVVVGATTLTAQWELDRGLGQDILEEHDIPCIPYQMFNDYDKAIKYVKKENERFVSKPSGDADKSLSYVSKSPADMVYMLERWKGLGKLKSPFIIQKFIGGTEMAVGGWFGPGGFNQGWCENWEFKKLMNGEMGPATGEQGTVVRYVRSSKLANKVLAPLEEKLEEMGYVGYIDVNCIIDDKGTPWPLEFTMRPGWPTFNIQQALHKGDHAEWLLDLAEGRDAKVVKMDTIAIGVVMSIPDYPYSHLTRKEVVGIPLYGITDPAMTDNLHLCEMMRGEAPKDVMGKVVTMPALVTAGDYVLVASGTGKTISEAKGAVYPLLEKLSMPNSPMWRTDIGDRLEKQLPKVQELGYAKNLTF